MRDNRYSIMRINHHLNFKFKALRFSLSFLDRLHMIKKNEGPSMLFLFPESQSINSDSIGEKIRQC